MLFSTFTIFPTYQIFLAAAIALFLMIVLTPLLISALKRHHFGQFVREDGPQTHIQKAGTPTMGGLLMIAILVAMYFLTAKQSDAGILMVLAVCAYGMIGFIDDYLGVKYERSLGLRARAKLFFELIATLLIGLAFTNILNIKPQILVPLTDTKLDLGLFAFDLPILGGLMIYPLYLVLVILIYSATTNSVNLTDGLDGLAAGICAIILLAFGGIAFRQDSLDLAIICTALAGTCIGFLWHNAHPAKIFMGDTGSLALGAAIASIAILTKTELFLPLIGGLLVAEALSVIIQVLSFRYFKKRVFKMAPIHHHFEIVGWSETQIMVRFWILAGLLAGIGFSMYFIGTT